MAVGAQAPKLTEAERGEVPFVRVDVISDRCRRDTAGVEADPAQRLDHQLMRAAALP
jgi:hypothetical protein